MHKSFLLRTVLLVFVLAAVLSIIITLSRFEFNGVTSRSASKQTFFGQFVMAGGPIVWFILLPMSLVTVYLAAKHSLTIRRKKLLPNNAGAEVVRLIQQQGPGQLLQKNPNRDDFVSIAVSNAFAKGGGDWFRMRTILAESLQDQAAKLLRKIEWINIIGNVSPMVGLFGTVYGMIKLFNTIVIAGGQPQPAQLADGISIALVTTFWGLSIAIPALAMHGFFRNRIESLAGEAVVETENIMPQIIKYLKSQKKEPKGPHITVKQKAPVKELKPKPQDKTEDTQVVR